MENILRWLDGIPLDTSPVESVYSGYGSFQAFEMPSSTPTTSSAASRCSSPKTSPAQVLTELPNFDPPIITTMPLKLPHTVLDLRSRLASNFGTAVIPTEFQRSILNDAPIEAIDIPSQAFTSHDLNATGNALTSDKSRKWEFAREIHRDESDCWEKAKDKLSWCELIISRLLRRGYSAGSFMTLLNVQSQNIEPTVLPKVPKGIKIPKQVDYAFSFNNCNSTVFNLLRNFQNCQPGVDVGITTTASSRKTLLLGALEAKSGSGDYIEAFTQLCIFLAALHKKYRLLTGKAPPPLPGIIVIGHEWQTYISWFENGRVCIHGPIEVARASTRTYYGIFKLLDLIARITLYAEEVFWPWIDAAFQSSLTQIRTTTGIADQIYAGLDKQAYPSVNF